MFSIWFHPFRFVQFAVTAATLGVIGFANVSFGEPSSGEMRRTEPARKRLQPSTR